MCSLQVCLIGQSPFTGTRIR
uniref:Uncharacterized protein n=1 Tax=Arundo donax TaxID=35708 RepID=A0A0A9FNV9_ARUDO